MKKEAFTIYAPVYNEIDSLPRLEQTLDEYSKSIEVERDVFVLFVNDGSTDGSEEALNEMCARHTHWTVLHFDRNYGNSSAFKAAIDYCQTPLLGHIDADLQTNPEDFNLMLPHMDEFALVCGDRVKRNDNWLRKTSTAVANKWRQLFTGDNFHDVTSPLKIMRTKYAKQMPFFNGSHRFIPVTFQMMGLPVRVVPIRHYPRAAGEAKYGLFNRVFGGVAADSFAYGWMIRRYLKYNFK